jgi:hypothetical protein
LACTIPGHIKTYNKFLIKESSDCLDFHSIRQYTTTTDFN